MLAVVELHDLGADHWLQRVVVVRQVGEAVLAPDANVRNEANYLRNSLFIPGVNSCRRESVGLSGKCVSQHVLLFEF